MAGWPAKPTGEGQPIIHLGGWRHLAYASWRLAGLWQWLRLAALMPMA